VDLLELMARAPGATAVLEALGAEPGVHVVGGAVRDALLGTVPRELDIVVEGDAVPVARHAAERLGGDVIVHDRFGTAIVRSPAATFDVVTARTETYAHPGALPDVLPGATIEQDLARRDFTVNAIGLRLADGALVEHPGARDDLAAGVLRVLHERSFEDDPTRLLRMARYAARLGFEPDPETDALAARATVDTVSGARLGSELRLLLREPQPAALLELERHDLGRKVVHPGFHADGPLIERALALTPPDARADLVALATTLVGAIATRHDLSEALDRLEFDARSRGIAARAAEGAVRLCDALEPDDLEDDDWGHGDAHLWRMLHRRTPEAVAVAGALCPGRTEEAARRWLDDVRHRRLAITGDDFVAAGLTGPAVGDALEAAQLAALAGEAPDAASQLAAGLAAVRPS
jgi:tRNA nucleotidyltransferase (CCA-adding enzyme)